ncbi:MAG TPA: gamma-glutamyltransferase [Candidatus Acidoferrales bacterium]|nr:gamma-glutamyltransferase [Candidatus Acidoferrales bacterium]
MRCITAVALISLLGLVPSRGVFAEWGQHGMVAADHKLASKAGAAILEEGGNAVDAAVAAAFAVCVVNPASCGIGGGGFMLIYLAQEHRAVALDYREVAPAAASRDMFVRDGHSVPELSLHGGLAVAVPGEVAGLSVAQHVYGTLPLAVVMEPAIRYARDGFAIEPHLAKEIADNRDVLRLDPLLARVFLRRDGSPRAAGEIIVQAELARTLQRIAKDGPDAFYRGDIATSLVSRVRDAGGILNEQDLAAYKPEWRQPISERYLDYDVISMPPPSSGGGVLLEALGILAGDNLRSLGRNTPTAAHLLAETMKHVFADRAKFYGDPGFVDVPLQRLLAPSNTAALRKRISSTRTFESAAYGSDASANTAAVADHGTSHLSVMDSRGNAVACTTTINTAFGAMIAAPDTGIILNDEMDDFSTQPGVPNVYGLVGAEANAIAPGKRPLSSMTPTIVTRNGTPVLAVGGSGGPLIISGTLQVLLDVLAYHMDVTKAVAAPRLHHQWSPAVLLVEPTFPKATQKALARNGHAVKEVPSMAAIQAVRRDGDMFEGAADPRKGGEAVGW